MIQDITPHILYNQYKDISPKKDDRAVVFDGRTVLISRSKDDTLDTPKCSDIKGKYQYILSVDDTRYFLLKSTFECEKDGEVRNYIGRNRVGLDGFTFEPIKNLRQLASKEVCFALMTAWHLHTWYKDNRYCGRCGAKTVHDHKERMVRCVKCGNMIYPKIAPAIIVAVTHEDRLLLTKYAPNREYQKYALIAGFVEIGETIEETVKREVEEEVGLKIKNLTYYKSQPWGYDSNVLMGYFAELDGDENITMDTEELSKAQWFKREELPAHDDGISLTREMIGVFEDKEKYEKTVKKC